MEQVQAYMYISGNIMAGGASRDRLPSDPHLLKRETIMQLSVEWLVFLGMLLSSRFIFLWWNGRGKERHRYPPSLPSLPLVGSLPFMRGFNNIAEFFMKKSEQLGPIFTLKAGSTVVLILNSREAIEDALVNHSSSFSGRSLLYTEVLVNPNSKGIISIKTSPEWKKYHQLTLSILKQLGFGVKSTMESRILTEVEFITDYVMRQNGKSFDPRELAHLSATNIIINILFGHRQDYDLGITELANHVKISFENLDPVLDIAPMLRFLSFHRNLLNQHIYHQREIRNIIRIETERSLKDGKVDCFACRYLKCVGEVYDDEQLLYTLRDLTVAATDTAANSILWALIALANNPDVQDRLRAEIDAAVPRDRLPSINDQPKLPFVEATILEILRWKTLVPLALPHLTLNDTNVGGYFIPAETLVLINLYAANMNPTVWKDPETFRPERFLDKNGQVQGRESVITFSLGRRSCLGEILARAELFLILTGLVQRFFIRPPEGQDILDEQPVKPVSLVLTSKPFNIRLINRL